MDIDLLAKMVGELILDHDEVALPGVGTFVAELMPANFSDKGFTINPPYRKLSFRQREGDSDVLIDFYARTNNIDKSVARDMMVKFLSELKDVLKSRKSIIFPGLGKLRATKENHFFFVPDENLNIYPEGFGLEPVSLKSHDIPAEGITDLAATVEAVNALTGQATAPAQEPSTPPEPTTPPAPPAQPVATAPFTDRSRSETKWLDDDDDFDMGRRGMPVILKVLILILVIAAIALAALAILGRVAPEFVDKLLYTQEQYMLIHG